MGVSIAIAALAACGSAAAPAPPPAHIEEHEAQGPGAAALQRLDWPSLFQGDFTLSCRVEPTGALFGDGVIFSWRQADGHSHMGAALGCQPVNRNSLRMLYFFVDATPSPSQAPVGSAASEMAARKAFIMMPLWPDVEPFDEAGRHDVIVRAVGPSIEIILDGIVRANKPFASCPIVCADTVFPRAAYADRSWVALGGERDGERGFPGRVGPFRAWNRALSDDEIRALSGGVFDGRYDRPSAWNQLGLFPNEWSYERRKAWIDDKSRRIHRELVESEPFYPRFHPTFVADTYNHMTVFHRGKYHLFPYFGWGYWNAFPIWDNWAFGHLISDDGVRWRMVDQVWKLPSINGTIVEERHSGGVYGLLGWSGPDFRRFHQDKALNVIQATDDDLIAWRKANASPLHPPHPERWIGGDCDVFEKDGKYCMVATACSQTPQPERNQLLLYESDNLLDWRYRGVFYQGLDSFTEAVHVFPLDGKWVLNGCHRIEPDAHYLIGAIEDGRFAPVADSADARARWMWNWATARKSPFAPTFWTVRDGNGRRVAHQWLYLNAYQFKYGIRESMRRGWNGSSYSLSQEVRMLPDGSAGLYPLEEYAALRQPGAPQRTASLQGDASAVLTCGAWVDIEARWRGAGEAVAIVVAKGEEELRIAYDDAAREARVDARAAPSALVQDGVAPAHFSGEEREIRCFLDGGLTEVYVAGRFFGFGWFTQAPGAVRVWCERDGGRGRAARSERLGNGLGLGV